MALKFRFNNKTYTLPVVPKTANTTQLASDGSLVIKTETDTVHAFLVYYKDNEDTISIGNIHYYYSSNSPSIHCRKNNKNYSCCNNYQEYYFSTWTFYSLYDKKTSKKVGYILNSFLGSDYNKYPFQTSLDPNAQGIHVEAERPDCIFKGWGTAADGSGDNYEIRQERSTNSDATFYALWARIDVGLYTAAEFWKKCASMFESSTITPTIQRVSNREAFLEVSNPNKESIIHIKVNSVISFQYDPNNRNAYIEVDGTTYYLGNIYNNAHVIIIRPGGWLVDKFLKVSDWTYAYSRTETWKTTTEGYTEYHWYKHYFTISVTVDASSTDVFDFFSVSNSGDWSGATVNNSDTMIGNSWKKTLSVQVCFISQIKPGGTSDTNYKIALRDRTNNVNAVVATYNIKTNLSFGTTESEE